MNIDADVEVVVTLADGSTAKFPDAKSISVKLHVFNNIFTYTKDVEDIVKERF